MVPDLCSIVEHNRLACIARGFEDDFFQREFFELGARDQLIQLHHISVVVFAVVKLKRFRRHMWLQRSGSVRKRGQGKWHRSLSVINECGISVACANFGNNAAPVRVLASFMKSRRENSMPLSMARMVRRLFGEFKCYLYEKKPIDFLFWGDCQ